MQNSQRIIQRYFIIVTLAIFLIPNFISATTISHQLTPLSRLYKRGTIEFQKKLVISRDKLPEHIHGKLIVDFSIFKDRVYALDALMNDIKVFSIDGKFQKHFGRAGKGPQDLLRPYYSTFSGDQLLVWESRNLRFSIFSPAGQFKRHFKPTFRGYVRGIKTLADGRIIVEREIFGWVKGKFEQHFGLELFSKDFQYLKDIYKREFNNTIALKKESRTLPRPFAPEVYWDVLPGNRIVLGYSQTYSFHIIHPDSGPVCSVSHPYTPVSILKEDKKIFFDHCGYTDSNGKLLKGADKFTWSHTVFPKNKPAFRKIAVDCDGNILIFPYGGTKEGSQYIATFFDAFTPEGEFINRVRIVNKDGLSLFKLICRSGNEFWVIKELEDMDSAIIRYIAK